MTAIATLRLTALILRNKRFLSNAQRLRSVSYMYAAAAVRRAQQPFNAANRRCNKLATTAVGKSGKEAQTEAIVDTATYERVCTETLESLCDYFEELTEGASDVAGSDVAFGDGVLTVNLGREHGTYVINRQSPNKQIWLSSPTSGPKRFDFVSSGERADGKWIYKHTGQSLHGLLQQELATIFPKQSVDFGRLPYSS